MKMEGVFVFFTEQSHFAQNPPFSIKENLAETFVLSSSQMLEGVLPACLLLMLICTRSGEGPSGFGCLYFKAQLKMH